MRWLFYRWIRNAFKNGYIQPYQVKWICGSVTFTAVLFWLFWVLDK